MGTKITFNGKEFKDSKESFLTIDSLIDENTKISGSMGTRYNYFVFNNVNKEKLVYYINEFNKLKNTEEEVNFVIQTYVGKAEGL